MPKQKTKVCTKCHARKGVNDFYSKKSECKKCFKGRVQQKRLDLQAGVGVQVPLSKICKYCEMDLPIDKFALNLGRKDHHETYCKECNIKYQIEWWTRNREEHGAKSAIWADSHPEQVREARKRLYHKDPQKHNKLGKPWREANREHLNELTRDHYHQNVQEEREYGTLMRKKHPDTRSFISIKGGAKKRGIPLQISREDFCVWYNTQPKVCHYCLIPEQLSQDRDRRRLTVDRMNNQLGYQLGNLVLACLKCNILKSDMFTYEEWMDHSTSMLRPKIQILIKQQGTIK